MSEKGCNAMQYNAMRCSEREDTIRWYKIGYEKDVMT